MSSDLGAQSIEDLRLMAQKRLPRGVFEYVDGAAEDGIAKANNREVYRSLKIKHRVLKNVSQRSTATYACSCWAPNCCISGPTTSRVA